MGIFGAIKGIAYAAQSIKAKHDEVTITSEEDMIKKFAGFCLEKGLAAEHMRMSPSDSEKASVYSSKIGGVPYMPKDFEYPCRRDGQPLRLLCQLNFAKLPHVELFPKEGILQIFISDIGKLDLLDYCGTETVQDDFRIIYHESIIRKESELKTAAEMPSFDSAVFPAVRERVLVPNEPKPVIPSCLDFRFEPAVLEFAKKYKLCPKSAESLSDIKNDACEPLYHRFSYPGFTGIGGFGSFIENDPRKTYLPQFRDCVCCIFQLSDIEETCPEDEDIFKKTDGRFQFFMPYEALKNRDFSRVMFNCEID